MMGVSIELIDSTHQYVRDNIGTFHARRLEKLQNLDLNDLLKRKNPYLLRAKGIKTGEKLVTSLLEAYLSSQEETIFGTFFEGLARFICGQLFEGVKSGIDGLDLDFTRDWKRYLVSIKSGPNWGNSDQTIKMKNNFTTLKKRIRSNNPQLKEELISVIGCCYGRDNKPDKGVYLKICGQAFFGNLLHVMQIFTYPLLNQLDILQRNEMMILKENTPD